MPDSPVLPGPLNDPSVEASIDTRRFENYTVTALVSIFRARRFIRACLEDLMAQSLYQKSALEIIIIDSASPQREWEIISEIARDAPHILAVRTAEREGLYQAWNRGINLSRGRYLTSANADDRHRRDSLETLAEYLDDNPNIALVYGDSLCTSNPDETFETSASTRALRWGDYSLEKLERDCCVGPQPLWRRSLHDEIGLFDPAFRSAGDYDFWLRSALKYPFHHIDEVLGLYWENPGSLEHQGVTSFLETATVKARHWLRKRQPLSDTPLVSIIIPTLNRPETLAEALKSLICQSYPHWEAWVINDGGPPVERGRGGVPDDDRIVIMNFDAHHERSYCRNYAIRSCHGKYISFLDDDDVLYPHHLEILIRAALTESGPSGVIYSDCAMALVNSGPEGRERIKIGPGYNQEFDRSALLVTNYVPVQALLIDADLLKSGLSFDEALNCLEDLDLLIRLSMKTDFHHVPVITSEVRVKAGHNASELRKHREAYRTIYERYFPGESGGWATQWRRSEWLKILDVQIWFQEKRPPVCSVILPLTGDRRIDSLVVAGLAITRYPELEFLFIDRWSDRFREEIERRLPRGSRVTYILSKGSTATSIIEAVAAASGRNIALLRSGVQPATQWWLGEMALAGEVSRATAVSGILLNVMMPGVIMGLEPTLDRAAGVTIPLYAGMRYDSPLIGQPRHVPASLPGMLLMEGSKMKSALAGSSGSSEIELWFTLFGLLARSGLLEIELEPTALGIDHCAAAENHPATSLQGITAHLPQVRSREECWIEDQLFHRSPGSPIPTPNHETLLNPSLREADRLTIDGDFDRAILTLGPLVEIYPGDKTLIKRLQELLAKRREKLTDSPR